MFHPITEEGQRFDNLELFAISGTPALAHKARASLIPAVLAARALLPPRLLFNSFPALKNKFYSHFPSQSFLRQHAENELRERTA